MFYVKEKIGDSTEIKVEINDENVHAVCPVCGREVDVDLSEIFSDGEADLFSTQVLCAACSKNIVKKEG